MLSLQQKKMKSEITLGTPEHGLQSTAVLQQQEFPNRSFTTQSPGPCIAENLGCSRAQTTQATESHAKETGSRAVEGTQNIPARGCPALIHNPNGITHAGMGTEHPTAAPAPNLHGKVSAPPWLGTPVCARPEEKQISARGFQSSTGTKAS